MAISIPVSGWITRCCLLKDYWLVPGGMIVRQKRLWMKDRVLALRPTDSTLFIDLNQSPGIFFTHDKEVFSLPHSADYCATAILIAWLSDAPLPKKYAKIFEHPFVPEKRARREEQLRQTPQISSVRQKS